MNELLPTPPDRQFPPGRQEAMRHLVIRRAFGSSFGDAGETATGLRTARSRRRLRAASLIAAALTVLLVVPMVVSVDSTPGAAAEVLNAAAEKAALQPPLRLEPGEYLHVEEVMTARFDGVGYAAVATGSRETWIAADGSGRIIDRPLDLVFPTPADRLAWIEDGRPAYVWGELPGGAEVTCGSYEPGRLNLNPLAALPADPDALYEVIRDRVVRGDIRTAPEAKQAATMLDEIFELLRNGYGPPEVRSALYHVAARLPGIELLGEVTDEYGRSGIAVGITWAGFRNELIMDKSGDLLGTRRVQVDPRPEDADGDAFGASPPPGVGVNADGVDDPGTLMYSSSLVEVGVVGSLPPLRENCGGVPKG